MSFLRLNFRRNYGLIITGSMTAIIFLSVLLVARVQADGQPWWNTSWKYRKSVSISSTPSLSNYDVLITVDTQALISAGKMKSGGSDIRFIDSLNTALSYWIESPTINTATTRIWVKVPSISAGSTTIWMYYGNNDATAVSNGASTFELFDDDWTFSATGGNPVHSATQSWWESTCSYPMVFEDTSFPTRPRFHMLFDGHNVIGHAKGYAYSADLKTWTEYDGGTPHPPNPNPILGVGYTGNTPAAWGDTIKVGSTYYMYYSRGPSQIYRAESSDLISWINLQPITGGTFGQGAAILKQGDGITPIPVGGKYWMVYFPGTQGSMYLASSTDLLDWTPYGSPTPILTPTPGGWDSIALYTPSFVRFDAPYNSYYIYYQGQGAAGWQTGYAKASAYSGGNPIAPDSTTWTKSSDAVIKLGTSGSWDSGFVIDPMIRKFDSTYYVFYTGNTANGYATSTSPEGPWTKLAPSVGSWTRNGGTVSSGILTLASGSSITSGSTYTYRAVGYRANWVGSVNKLKWAGFKPAGPAGDRTMIGTTRSDTLLYLKNLVGTTEAIAILSGVALGNFHVFEVLWKSGQSKAIVDHGAITATLSTQVPTTALPVTFNNYEDNTYSLQVDWVFVRPYSSPDPTTSVGVEETSITEITVSCSPDTVLKTGTQTTTISGHLTSVGSGVSGKTIKLYYQGGASGRDVPPPTEGTWTYIASSTTVSGGDYNYAWDPPETLTNGYYWIKAEFEGDTNYHQSSKTTGVDLISNLFVIPEYAIGPVLALAACFAGVMVYRSKRFRIKPK